MVSNISGFRVCRGAAKGGLTRALSVAAADRRIDRAVQIALPRRLALPSDRLAAARKIADAIAFDIRTARARQLDHNTQCLIRFLDACLDSADAPLLGGGGVATGLLRTAGIRNQEASQRCKSHTEDPYFPKSPKLPG